MDLGLNGKRAIVAAGTAGLGLGAAMALAAEGAHVAVCGRDAERLAAAVESIGLGAIGMEADVSTVAGAEAFIAAARHELGGVDILVTNGGGPAAGNAATTPLESYPGALELNLTSQVAMCLACVEEMKAQQWGRIVAITSVAVRQPIAHLILSNTARSGYTGFLKTLAREVASFGVTVNSLQPGLHATDRLIALYDDPAAVAATIPAGRLGDPADFGAFVAWMCSTRAAFVTGAQIPVDGGAYAGLL
ncbi:MAG: SDR family oxidoreductase [Acidimicrobiia bacterium]